MKIETVYQIAQEWEDKLYNVLDLNEISTSEMEELLKKTYEVLYEYHTENTIPKSVCKLLLNVDEFMTFFVMIGDNEDKLKNSLRMYKGLYDIIDDMKKGFFDCEYEEDFPMLKVEIDGNNVVINMDEPFLAPFIDE